MGQLVLRAFDQQTRTERYVLLEMAADCDDSLKRLEAKDRSRNENVVSQMVERVKHLVETISDHHSIGVIMRTNQEVGELIFRLQDAGIRRQAKNPAMP